MDVFEAMSTARAIRRFKPDPVPEKVIRDLVYYATRASNPQNSQMWEFIIVDDAEKRRAIGTAVSIGLETLASQRGVSTSVDLGEMLSNAPAIILVAARNEYPPWGPDERFVGSACYPAGQNLVVAARALGIGATFTMLHQVGEDAIREILEIPDGVVLALTIPIGYPDREFGPVNRKPIDEVIRWNRF